MGLTTEFHQAVASGDVLSIRVMMKDSLLVDPSFRQFNEMEKEARSIQDLYQDHDGQDFQDKCTWNDDYMNKLMVQVMNNFSKQRVNHLKKVVECLRTVHQDSNPNHTPNENIDRNEQSSPEKKRESDYQKQKLQDQKDGKYLRSKLPIGAVAGGVCGGVTASLVGVSVVGGVVSGVIIGTAGTVVICKINEKRD